MTSQNLREKFLGFFEKKGHKIIPPSSLIPEATDPTVLFTTAGMHPLVPYLLGEKHPQGARLTNFQKCIRTGDIDSVGDAWHLTFFEMLGNWSLGDYFKQEAIEFAWEFLTNKKWLGIEPGRLSVSVFAGDQDASRDEEAAEIWQKVGIPKERIYFYPKSENWWGPAGETGPCGPDTEIFYDTGKPKCSRECELKCSCGKYAEIWNLVFMQYNKIAAGTYEPLQQKNVDTGMGLERTVAILNGQDNVYETDLFGPIIQKIQELMPQRGELTAEQIKSVRIIADHLRAATFILADGVVPSRHDRGYVLRRLIRGAVKHAKLLRIPGEKNLFLEIAEVIIQMMYPYYPELERNKMKIVGELKKEKEKFEKVLAVFKKWYKGPLVFWLEKPGVKEEIKERMSKAPRKILAPHIFKLVTEQGIPLEFIKEEAKEAGVELDEKGFQKLFKKHQKLSRKGAEKKFKGGLVDASEKTIKYHTATHLLHQALRKVLGKHVEQRGSNITPERLRFDFSHPTKMTPEEIKKVENLVNQKIEKKLPIVCEEMSPAEAKKKGAIGLFVHKYGDKVKVYSIGNFSKEICGGPHIKNTGELGKFQIIKEESVSAGVRRIKAILE